MKRKSTMIKNEWLGDLAEKFTFIQLPVIKSDATAAQGVLGYWPEVEKLKVPFVDGLKFRSFDGIKLEEHSLILCKGRLRVRRGCEIQMALETSGRAISIQDAGDNAMWLEFYWVADGTEAFEENLECLNSRGNLFAMVESFMPLLLSYEDAEDVEENTAKFAALMKAQVANIEEVRASLLNAEGVAQSVLNNLRDASELLVDMQSEKVMESFKTLRYLLDTWQPTLLRWQDERCSAGEGRSRHPIEAADILDAQNRERDILLDSQVLEFHAECVRKWTEEITKVALPAIRGYYISWARDVGSLRLMVYN